MSLFENDKTLTPTELNLLLQTLIESTLVLDNITITGQLTNLKFYQAGGQLYFNLFDGQSRINCVIYKTYLDKLKTLPKEGEEVSVIGSCKWQARRGQLIFQSVTILPKGLGQSHIALEKLRKKLFSEGLFDESRKKPVPDIIENVALITAANSAAFWDFVRISRDEFPNLNITLIPATMQGDSSPASVIQALSIVYELDNIDAAVILRGGGSQEDLACFNNESLVRKAAESPIPIISAIGHEIDVTLLDFVADYRAATPTAAAKRITMGINSFKATLPTSLKRIHHSLESALSSLKETHIYLQKAIQSELSSQIKTHLSHVNDLHHRVALANPLFKLKQGYSICRDEKTNAIIKRLKDTSPGKRIKTTLLDGDFYAEVTS